MTETKLREQKHKRRRGRWWKIPTVTACIILVLIALALAATQTGWFRNWVKEYAVETTNESINGKLSIASLEGNLFTNVQINGISLTAQDDTLLHVEAIEAHYDLWALLDNTILIESIRITNPAARITQEADSTWNFMRLVPEQEADTAESSFDYLVELRELVLSGGSLRIVSPDTLIPHSIDSINVQLAATYATDTQQLDLKKLTLKTNRPDFSILDFGIQLSADEEKIEVSSLHLQTRQNLLRGHATIPVNDYTRSAAEISIDSLDLAEFSQFLPALPRELPPIDIVVTLESDSLLVDVAATEGDQSLSAQFRVSEVFSLVEDTTWNEVRYGLQASFANLRPGYWLDDPSLDYKLSGDATISGTGIDPEEMSASYSLNLKRGRLSGYQLTSANLRGEYIAGDVNARITATSNVGSARATIELSDLLGEMGFAVDASLSKINLANLLEDDSLASDLNLGLQASGGGQTLEELVAEATITMHSSSAIGIDVDTVFSRIAFRDEFITIDTAFASLPMVQFQLGGGIGLSREGSIAFELRPNDVGLLASYLELDTLVVEGEISGTITGSLTDFTASLKPTLRDLVYDDITVDSILGEMNISFVDSSLSTMSGQFAVSGTTIGDFVIQQMEVAGEQMGESISLTADVLVSDDTNLKLESTLSIDSLVYARPLTLIINLPNQTWEGTGEGFVIDPTEQAYRIENLVLNAGGTKDTTAQLINVDGTFSLVGNENLTIDIKDLSLAGLAELFKLEQQLTGKLSLSSSIIGTASDPEMTAELDLRNGTVGDYSYQHLAGLMNYRSDSLDLSLDLIASEADTFAVDAYFPVSISMIDTGEVFSYDRPFSLTARARRLPLASLKAFVPNIERASGFLAFEVNASNTLRDPRATGSLSIKDASLKMPEYGIDYNRITLDVEMTENRINIKEMSARRGDGHINLTGSLEYDSTIVAGDIRSTEVKLVADDFYVTRHSDYEIQIDANTNLSGPMSAATFGGRVTVLRSRIYLPRFTETDESAEMSGEPPLLVQATRPIYSDSLDTTAQPPIDEDDDLEEPSQIYENLRGRMVIEIPKNTWLRSPDLKMEISGSIEVVKEGPEPELFGSISVVRGHYDVFGKRFAVDEGALNFQGGVEMNPVLNIKAYHDMRAANREKKRLSITVTGTAESPNLQFSIDGTSISEGDAVSYLAFGKSLDQLTYGERNELSGSESGSSGEGSLASGVLASLVSSQITKALGSELSVDVFEVNAQSDWKAATFVVGKYLTNDLFVSYERAVGDIEDDDIAQQVVTLEYELTRIIYLQLIEGDAKASGFDIIFKWQNQKAF